MAGDQQVEIEADIAELEVTLTLNQVPTDDLLDIVASLHGLSLRYEPGRVVLYEAGLLTLDLTNTDTRVACRLVSGYFGYEIQLDPCITGDLDLRIAECDPKLEDLLAQIIRKPVIIERRADSDLLTVTLQR